MVDFNTNNGDDEEKTPVQREERNLGPVAFFRKVMDTMKQREEGRVSQIGMGSVTWKHSKFDHTQIEVGFHEMAIENTFEFRPHSGRGAEGLPLGRQNPQATDITELGGDISVVGGLVETLVGFKLAFTELDAASIASEHFTDFEFNYEQGVETQKIMDANVDDIVEEYNRRY